MPAINIKTFCSIFIIGINGTGTIFEQWGLSTATNTDEFKAK
jgi:hypothetical protein